MTTARPAPGWLCAFLLVALASRVCAQLPDLAPTGLTWPGVLTADQYVTLAAAITNYGPGVAGPLQFAEQVTLCRTNSLLDTNQILQTFLIYDGAPRTVPAGSAYTNSRDVKISGTVPAGDYYLILEANQDPRTGQPSIPEVTRTNNTLVKPVTITYPDLAPIDLSWTGALVPGQTTSFSCLITNYGPGSAGPLQFSELCTLSRTNDPGATNQVVQRFTLYNYATYFRPAGTHYQNGADRQISSSITPGFYYLILEANKDTDGNPLFAEGTRTNNLLIKRVSIGLTDLALTSMTVTNPLAIAGQSTYVSFSVVNTSSNTLNAGWSTRFVLSTTPDLAGALGTNIFNESPVLLPGAVYSTTHYLNVPPVAPGTNYYLVLDVDSANTVPEENEENNRKVLAIAVTNLLPSLALIAPTNQIQATSCVPTRVVLSAQVQGGSYPVASVVFLDNETNVIPAISQPPYWIAKPALPHGDHTIRAECMDSFGFHATSTTTPIISLRWPTNLHQLYVNLATNGDMVGCMCGYPGSNYVIEASTNVQAPSPWQPYVTNQAGPDVVAFTNNRANPRLFFRARLAP